MAIPQFPNVFWGDVSYDNQPAPTGMTVTGVVTDQAGVVRRSTIFVTPTGRFGSPNGLKLKVGGVGTPIPDKAPILFYVTQGPLHSAPPKAAGHSVFYADSAPHVTRIELAQGLI